MMDSGTDTFRSSDASAQSIKDLLQPYAQKKLLLPLLILFGDALIYGTLLVGAVALHAYWQRFLCGALAGFAIGMLFVVGHDACHGSYTQHKWLNHLLGRIAFLPSLHAFSTWNLGHNRIHHRYTNLKREDYVWRPYSKQEFDSLPSRRQWLEKLYRTSAGLGFYYMFEIWWKKIMFPNRREVPKYRAIYFWDSCLVALFLCLQIPGMIWLGNRVGTYWLDTVIFGIALPFVSWNWIMGFVIFQHHTHPSVAWFDDAKEWRYWESQIAGTTHVRFPKLLSLLMHNIMEHTAHHALTSVPLYNLIKAQSAIEMGFTGRVKVIPWTVEEFINTVKRCKLYDYERHVWLDFAGNTTSEPTVAASSALNSQS